MTEMGHLLVADALFAKLGWSDRTLPAMYLGCVAPDAYRATTGVDYRQTHFRSSHRPGMRLTDFLQLYLRPSLLSGDHEARAFHVGWLSHICTDYIWRQQIRFELPQLWDSVLAAPTLEAVALKHQFYDECDWVDIQLYQARAELLDEVRWRLMAAECRFAVPPLQPGDIFRWRQQVVEGSLPPPNYTVETPQLISVSFVEQAITQACDETRDMLTWETRLAQEGEEGTPVAEPPDP
jgi:hypothetical protein